MQLGLDHGLTWSTTDILKIDLVGPAQRGLAYLLAGYLAEQYGLCPAPCLLCLAYTAQSVGVNHRLPRYPTRCYRFQETAVHGVDRTALSGTGVELSGIN
ncbi:hypothetical protein [Paeniglutamicibacter quisquiliarum]|uniref:hypothetical protein n=1 Tax=Paeniglutamicibacter quisquiliarum TaxID=2849498 RepID=UPI003AB957B5